MKSLTDLFFILLLFRVRQVGDSLIHEQTIKLSQSRVLWWTSFINYSFSVKKRTFEVNTLFIIWLFALVLQARKWLVGITGE